MVVFMLYSNLNFSGTEEKREEGWKATYKYGKFKSFMNQSSFKIETGSRLDMSPQRWERFL